MKNKIQLKKKKKFNIFYLLLVPIVLFTVFNFYSINNIKKDNEKPNFAIGALNNNVEKLLNREISTILENKLKDINKEMESIKIKVEFIEFYQSGRGYQELNEYENFWKYSEKKGSLKCENIETKIKEDCSKSNEYSNKLFELSKKIGFTYDKNGIATFNF